MHIRRWISYAAMVACGLVLGVAFGFATAPHTTPFGLAVGLIALLGLAIGPRRIVAHFYADLSAGAHCLRRNEFELSKIHSQRFLAQITDRPWIKNIIWLGSSDYSRYSEVLALSNLGAAEIFLDELGAAEEHLRRAMALDPKCPLPYQNMGVLSLHRSPLAVATPWFEQAKALGLKGDVSNRIATGNVVAIPEPKVIWTAPHGPYVVKIYNDDRTPVSLVILALKNVFKLTRAEALSLVRLVEAEGEAVCAAFHSLAEAQSKADEIRGIVRVAGYSLEAGAESTSLESD